MAITPFNKAFSPYSSKSPIFQTKKTEEAEETGKAGRLSKQAEEYLEKLKKKYKNVDFIVKDYNDDSQAGKHLSRGKGEYNCLITPELLEKMASDEETAVKYEGIIDDAITNIDGLKQSAAEKGLSSLVEKYGYSVNANGEVNYYAIVRDSLPSSSKTEESKNGDKNVKEKDEKSHIAKADTVEGLLSILEEINSGDYKNTVPYLPEGGERKDGFRQGRGDFDLFKNVNGRRDGFDGNSTQPGAKDNLYKPFFKGYRADR